MSVHGNVVWGIICGANVHWANVFGELFVRELSQNCPATRLCQLSLLSNSKECSCNCRNKGNFSLAGSCLKTCIVQRADVNKQNETHIYYDISDGELKYWYNNHTNLVWNQDYENKTELSKHVWQLQCNGIKLNLKWSIAVYAAPYRCGT